MIVQAYLNFAGRCEEAINFYRKALGAEVIMMMRFKEAPATGNKPAVQPLPENVMHSAIRIGDTTLMATDGPTVGRASFSGVTLSLSVATDADAKRYFGALSEGGQVSVPLEKTFFASSFGMVTDRFGVPWIVLRPNDGMPS